jgi:hypothetical protein
VEAGGSYLLYSCIHLVIIGNSALEHDVVFSEISGQIGGNAGRGKTFLLKPRGAQSMPM